MKNLSRTFVVVCDVVLLFDLGLLASLTHHFGLSYLYSAGGLLLLTSTGLNATAVALNFNLATQD